MFRLIRNHQIFAPNTHQHCWEFQPLYSLIGIWGSVFQNSATLLCVYFKTVGWIQGANILLKIFLSLCKKILRPLLPALLLSWTLNWHLSLKMKQVALPLVLFSRKMYIRIICPLKELICKLSWWNALFEKDKDFDSHFWVKLSISSEERLGTLYLPRNLPIWSQSLP